MTIIRVSISKLNFTKTEYIACSFTEIYDVSFSGYMMLDQFVKLILKKKESECGSIDYKGIHSLIEYKNGEITSQSVKYEEIKYNYISSIKAYGCFGRVDYVIDKTIN